MVVNIQEILKITKEMVMENKFIKVEIFIKDNGLMI